MKMDFIYTRTEDDLQLQGVHYDSETRDTLVLFIHGMGGNVIENYFAHVLGQTLSKNGVSFLFSHNRGYNHINDITIRALKEDLDLIASKATSCPSFTKQHILKASHTYDGREKEVAEVVLHWVKNRSLQ